ncbi:hypothetical protein X848_gp28 [Edwardsiella phage PEi21]|uniref:Uncharacterized protein n=1 Tax=Edwardsiella phage PEi21 TaxID=1325372 RepID=N0DSC4_9CAUD|nr:hypothetical protein X848_gp28 [Edwardsiella phage PEi21]QXV72917.1 hypothetical protein [Edwardsiella phage PVN06]BAN16838.1 hypothetical protein [Edwardsiella phage PEi21]
MTVKSFTIGNVTYRAAMASAFDQDKILSLLTGTIAERAMAARIAKIPLDSTFISSVMMALPHGVKSEVAGMLLAKCFVSDTNTPVTVKDFQGGMMAYNRLLAELWLWNFDDFFTYLVDVASTNPTVPEENPAL